MKEAEYGSSSNLEWHRRLSLLVVLVMLAAAAYYFGVGRAVRLGAGYVFPLVLIWQSDHLAYWAIQASGQWLSVRNADKWVRVTGWIILFLISFVPMMAMIARWR